MFDHRGEPLAQGCGHVGKGVRSSRISRQLWASGKPGKPQSPSVNQVGVSHRNGHRVRIHAIRSRHNIDGDSQVLDVASHGTERGEAAIGSEVIRNYMAGQRESALRRLQRGDSTHVSRLSRTAPRVTTYIECRSTCGQNCGRSSTTARRGALEVVGIIGASEELVASAHTKRELRRVGLADDDSARRPKPGHYGGVTLRR